MTTLVKNRNLFGLIFLISGCTTQSSRLPSPLLKGAVDGMWTARSNDAVRSCIGSVTASSGEPLFVIVSNDLKTSVYQTTVNIFPAATHDDRRKAVNCL